MMFPHQTRKDELESGQCWGGRIEGRGGDILEYSSTAFGIKLCGVRWEWVHMPALCFSKPRDKLDLEKSVWGTGSRHKAMVGHQYPLLRSIMNLHPLSKIIQQL